MISWKKVGLFSAVKVADALTTIKAITDYGGTEGNPLIAGMAHANPSIMWIGALINIVLVILLREAQKRLPVTRKQGRFLDGIFYLCLISLSVVVLDNAALLLKASLEAV